VPSEPERALLAEMRATFDRLQLMVADLHPADEVDPGKAELVANMKQKMVRLPAGIEDLERELGTATTEPSLPLNLRVNRVR
jgi:hypothetical protein